MPEAPVPRAPVSADHFLLEYQQTPKVNHAKRRRIDGETVGGDESEIVDLEPVALPLPHQLPSRKYAADDVPWVWDRNYLDPDVTGEVWLPGGVAGEDA
jgi:tyrosyl-DNA phosphodiesterase-1